MTLTINEEGLENEQGALLVPFTVFIIYILRASPVSVCCHSLIITFDVEPHFLTYLANLSLAPLTLLRETKVESRE